MLLGIVGALIMYLGARADSRRDHDAGQFLQFTMFLALLIAPVLQIVGIGTQITEALAGLERTREILNESDGRRRTRAARGALGRIAGEVAFDDVGFAYDDGQAGAARHLVSIRSRGR